MPQPQNNTRSILNNIAEGLGHQGFHLFKGVDALLIIADNQAKVAQAPGTSQTMYARYERDAKRLPPPPSPWEIRGWTP